METISSILFIFIVVGALLSVIVIGQVLIIFTISMYIKFYEKEGGAKMNEFESVIDFLKSKGIDAYENKSEINVDVESRKDILPMVLKLKKYLRECNYRKSWRVGLAPEFKPMPAGFEEGERW